MATCGRRAVVDDEAFRSELRVTFDDPSPAIRIGPVPIATGVVSSDPNELVQELTRRVVQPVVASLFTPEEVQGMVVHRQGDDLVLILDALDERSWSLLLADVSTDGEVDFGVVAEQLANGLEDFACETRLGWGQQRVAAYTVLD